MHVVHSSSDFSTSFSEMDKHSSMRLAAYTSCPALSEWEQERGENSGQ